jgi:TetR/AcrR family transcriptional regulator of autoinduction and epiphytic fitness
MLTRTDRSRALILDAAVAVFRDKSYDAVTMEEIAQRAGLTRKTLYNLFASKDEIVAQVMRQVDAEHDPIHRARLAANEPALALLEDIFQQSARWCLDNPTLATLALTGPVGRPSPSPPPGSFHHLIRDILVLGQRQGAIRADEDADVMALMLLALYAKMMLHAIPERAFDAGRLTFMLRLIVEGIGAPAAASPTQRSAIKRASTSRTPPSKSLARRPR